MQAEISILLYRGDVNDEPLTPWSTAMATFQIRALLNQNIPSKDYVCYVCFTKCVLDSNV